MASQRSRYDSLRTRFLKSNTNRPKISRAGRWQHDAMTNVYLTALPIKFMRVTAGFSAAGGDYLLPRAGIVPPVPLQFMVWPWVEQWELRFRRRAQKKNWSQGGLDQTDQAGHNFIKLLLHLRVVLLQDLAVLQPAFPDLPLFSDPLFQSERWLQFSGLVQTTCQEAADNPENVLLQRAVPEIATAISTARDAVNQQGTQAKQEIMTELQQLRAMVSGLTDGSNPLVIEVRGQFRGNDSTTATAVMNQTSATLQPSAPPASEAVTSAETPSTAGQSTAAVFESACPPQASRARDPPTYRFGNPQTVRQCWAEWTTGLHGGPAVRDLEDEWGPQWRPDRKQRVTFCRRKVIWDEVTRKIERDGVPEETAIVQLEQKRGSRSLYALHNELQNDSRKRKRGD